MIPIQKTISSPWFTRARQLLPVLAVAAIGAATAQAQTITIEARGANSGWSTAINGTPGPANWGNSTTKSTVATDVDPARVGSFYPANGVPDQSTGPMKWLVSPTLPKTGTWQVYITHSPATASTDLVVSITATDATGLPDETGAFAAANGHTWELVGTMVATTTKPSIEFAYKSGAFGATAGRWYLDAIKFVYVPTSATVTWTGAGDDNNFSTGDNWDEGVAPADDDKVVLAGTTRLNPNLDSSLNLSGFAFAANAGAFTIGGSGTLTVSGSITNSSANLQTIGVPLVISGSERVINTGSGGIAATAGTTAANGFIKAGAGSLILEGGSNPNLNGTISINAGNVVVNSNEQIANNAVVAIANGASLTLADNVSETIRRVASGNLTAQNVSGVINLGENAHLTMAPDASFNGANSASAVQINGAPGSVFTLASGELRWTPQDMVNTFEKLVVGSGAILRAGHGGNNWLPPDTMFGAVPDSFMQDQITLNGGQLGINSVLAGQTVELHPNRGITISGNATIETYQNVVIPGKITGTGTLIHNGGGALELAGENDFSGGLRLGSGPVVLANESAAGTGTITFLNDGGGLRVSAPDLVIPNPIDLSDPFVTPLNGTIPFTLSGDVNLGDGSTSTRINVSAGTVTLSGSLTNELGFAKDGAGTLVLAGNSTFTGSISVSNGVLHYASTGVTAAETLNVYNGTVSGTGTANHGVNVMDGGKISAGASVGTFNTGSQLWHGGASAIVEINDALGTPGSGWDLLNITGDLNILATTENKFIVKVVSLSGDTPGTAANFDGEQDYEWVIATTTDGITGFVPGAFNIDASEFTGASENGIFTLAVEGNNLVLKYASSVAPFITDQPDSKIAVVPGTKVIISAAAEGTAPLTYSWKKDNSPLSDDSNISGSSTPTLTIESAQLADSGIYVLVVSNDVGVVESDPAELLVVNPPVITGQPSGASVAAGGNFNPTVTVNGAGTLQFQWKKDGVNLVNGGNISGADTASLLVSSVGPDDAGDYTVVVSNEVGSDTSTAANLKVLSAPVITQHPQNQSVAQGEQATFTVAATGSDLEYQWRFNGDDIPGATESSLTVDDVQVGKVGYYSVRVHNSLGEEVSTSATLSIGYVVTFYEDFEDGDLAGWTVNGATPMQNVSGEQNAVPVGGNRALKTTHSAAQTTRGVNLSGAFRLTAHIYDNGGKNSTANVNRRNQMQLWGTGTQVLMIGMNNGVGTSGTSPASNDNKYQGRVRNGVGGTFFNLDDEGSPNRSTGWHKFTIERDADLSTIRFYVDGVLSKTFTGADNATMTELRLGFGAGTDTDANTGPGYFDGIEIAQPPSPLTITDQPDSITVDFGGSAEFSVTATGAQTYQWQKDGQNLPGKTSATLQLSNVTKDDEGVYTVIVANAAGPVTSSAATLTVNDPVITDQPQNAYVVAGGTATFQVAAAGSGILSYQWYHNDTPLANGSTATLQITNVSVDDEGQYKVEVTGDNGTVTSDVVTLDVQDALIVSGPASTSVNQGEQASFSVSIVSGEAPYSYQWFHEGNEIPDATEATYVIPSAQPADAGSYTVLVSNLADSVEAGPAVLTVVPDETDPVLKVVSPKKNGVYTDELLVVSGTVKDLVGVASVKYWVNGGSEQTATLEPAGKVINWSGEASLKPGTNEIVVVARDLAGNEMVVGPLPFFYHVSSPLLIQRTLNGDVINTNGVGEVVNTIKAPIDGDNTTLFVGRGYQLKAVVASQEYILTNWTATWDGQAEPVVIQTNDLVCRFEMKSNMVISANFIDNPFYRFGGVYVGLFSDPEGVAFESAGYAQLKVTPKQTFSAKLMVDGNSVSVSGKFDINGVGTGTSKSRGKSTDKPEITLNVQLDFENGSETLTGTVTDGNWTSELVTDRVIWSKTNSAEQPLEYANSYTMLLSGFEEKSEGPVGTGHATILVNTNMGKVKVAGFASDFQKIKGATHISKDGRVPFYSVMYPIKRSNALEKVIKETKGMQIGWLEFRTNDLGNMRAEGEVHWHNTGWTNAVYSDGFTKAVEVRSSLWVHDKANPGNTLASMPFVELTFSEGNLDEPFSNVWSVDPLKSSFKPIKFLKPAVYVYENAVKAGVAPKTGVFKGTFIHPENPELKVKYIGAILQDDNYGEGTFMGITEGGKVELQTGVQPTPPSE